MGSSPVFAVRLKRSAIFVHRWLGVVLCLLFTIWFSSGIGMMYWSYPGVTAADRLERSPALDASTVRLSPEQAYAKIANRPLPTPVVLNSFDSRPVYRFGDGAMVYADTGEGQVDISHELMLRVAAAWTGQPAKAAHIESVEEVDQWTVGGAFRYRPLWKYSWPDGDQVYITERAGEVVQYTTATSRLGAYVSAIPHWLYFTPLRKHGLEWSRVVIWSSGIGTFAALLGVAIGIWMYSPGKRYRNAGVATSIPYRGQKRWHMVFGLLFGLGAATWAFSGMLSLEPFPPPSGEPTGDNIPEALQGRVDMAAYAAKHPRQALAQLSQFHVKQLEFTSFAGDPIYLATLAGGATYVVQVDGEPRASFDAGRIINVVTSAVGRGNLAEIRVLDQYDAYYLDRRARLPLPVILARLNDAADTRYYINPKTARVVSAYNSSGWMTRWLYHGLHSLNFPWLYKYRPLWDIVVITFMLGGTAVGVTSLILAWRVIGRTLRGAILGAAGGHAGLSDDLAVEGEFDARSTRRV